jgi:hypothetical protein
MKNLIIAFLTFVVSQNLLAGPGGGGGGIGTVPTLRVNSDLRSMTHELRIHRDQIEALRTYNGDYARFEDLKDGLVRFRGVSVMGNQIKLELNNLEFEVESVILTDGTQEDLTGGDMGGGK